MSGQVPKPCRIYRILHFDNLAGIIEHGGIWCSAEMVRRALPYKQIGLQALTSERKARRVETGQGGRLSDYVPFYFCPRSIMLFQIHSGKSDYKEGQEPILHLVTTVEKIMDLRLPFAISDRHAKTSYARFFDDTSGLAELDWDVISSRTFARQEDDPDRPTRKQAEFLVHRFVPLDAVLGIGVISQRWKDECDQLLSEARVRLRVKVQPSWYY